MMNEAPKKVWIHEGFWRSGDAGYWTGDEKTFSEDIHYIRADIVDELAEALKYVMTAHGEQLSDAFEKAQNVLAKLEEE